MPDVRVLNQSRCVHPRTTRHWRLHCKCLTTNLEFSNTPGGVVGRVFLRHLDNLHVRRTKCHRRVVQHCLQVIRIVNLRTRAHPSLTSQLRSCNRQQKKHASWYRTPSVNLVESLTYKASCVPELRHNTGEYQCIQVLAGDAFDGTTLLFRGQGWRLGVAHRVTEQPCVRCVCLCCLRCCKANTDQKTETKTGMNRPRWEQKLHHLRRGGD